MFVPNRELGSFLLDARLISRDDLARLRAEENLFEAVRSQNLVEEDELTRAVAHVLGVPFGEVRHEEIDEEALTLVPEPLARMHAVAVFKVEGHRAHVMLLNTDSLEHLSYLETEHHLHAVPHLTDRASLKRALLLQQKRLKEKFALRLKAAAPAEVFDALISHALLSRAGEVYLDETSNGNLRVRYRIGSVLHDAMTLAPSARALMPLLKESAGLSLTLNAPQEGRVKLLLKSGGAVRVGVFSLPRHGGESMHLSLAPENAGKQGYTLESLGLKGEALEVLSQTLARAEGLILLSAPAQSGKTTALYTLLDLAASANTLAVSVEEKVALTLPHATQVEVKRELGQTIASALRATLKTNPDVVMVDEIKNDDEAALAVSAAARGVFVVASVKAGSASKAIQKMLSLGVDPLFLSATLRAAVGERVVRKLCPHCKIAFTPSRSDLEPIEAYATFAKVLAALKADGVLEQGAQWKDVQFYKAVGCEKCGEGYEGITALFEVLPVSAITRELIADRDTEKDEQDAKLREHMPLNLIEDGLLKSAMGLTTIEEVINAIGE